MKLVNFDASTMGGRYTALSYCWGSQEELEKNGNLVTTTKRHDTFMAEGILISELPMTIRQAVWVTYLLGQSYIWVDSLCIIQDDHSDWEIESLRMATVYSMAVVTIIAASSTSCHSGFLPRRSSVTTFGKYHVKLLPHISLHAVSPPYSSGFHTFPAMDPIDARGWTYQEEYLSSRYLKFTRDDIQWKCNAGAVCLCGEELEDTPQYNNNKNSNNNLKQDGSTPWEVVVRGFSGRVFTNETDKLPAISGLAERFATEQQEETVQSRYIAGCWEDRIMSLADLLWSVELSYIPGEVSYPPESYVAPSFTWPSVNKRVFFPNSSDGGIVQPLCEVIRVNVQPLSPDRPFGRVLPGGELVVRGPLIRRCILQVAPSSDRGDFTRFKVRINEGFVSYPLEHPDDRPTRPTSKCYLDSTSRCYLDCRVSESASLQGVRSLHRCQGLNCPLISDTSKHHRLLDLEEPIRTRVKDLAEVDVLLVLTKKHRAGWRAIDALVLGRPDPNSHVYQRIGLVQWRPEGPILALEASGLEPWMTEVMIQ